MVLKFCKISAKECKKRVVECKKRPVHLNTKKQPQSCCLFDFLLKFFCLNVPETYYLELSETAYNKYLEGNDEIKRKIVNSILSNLTLRDGKLSYTYKKPFDILAKGLSCSKWWAAVDSNHRPHAYQACALTT